MLMSKVGAPENLIVNGKRLDGRALDEMRSLESGVRVIKKALGSGSFRFGGTYAIAAVYGPKAFFPKGLQDPQRAILKTKYNMSPFSTLERFRPGRSRRSTEISKVINEALSQVVFFEDFPKTGIDVFIEILEAEASTRCAGLNAAAIALADAGIPMKDLVSSCSVGKIDGTLVADISRIEDNYGEVDMAVATVGGQDKFVLLQMDGILTRDEFKKLLEMSVKSCAEVYENQKAAIIKEYETGDLNDNGSTE
jgi:exosome complex component RRP41